MVGFKLWPFVHINNNIYMHAVPIMHPSFSTNTLPYILITYLRNRKATVDLLLGHYTYSKPNLPTAHYTFFRNPFNEPALWYFFKKITKYMVICEIISKLFKWKEQSFVSNKNRYQWKDTDSRNESTNTMNLDWTQKYYSWQINVIHCF